jgi:hypothetical protein
LITWHDLTSSLLKYLNLPTFSAFTAPCLLYRVCYVPAMVHTTMPYCTLFFLTALSNTSTWLMVQSVPLAPSSWQFRQLHHLQLLPVFYFGCATHIAYRLRKKKLLVAALLYFNCLYLAPMIFTIIMKCTKKTIPQGKAGH